MESGKLQFDWEQSQENIALISFGSNGEESFSLLQQVIDEASASYPQLAQLRFMHIPIPVSKLERWSHWLAAQVVKQWRDLRVEERSVVAIVNELGLSSVQNRDLLLEALDSADTDASPTLKLAMRFESLRSGQRQQDLTPLLWKQWLDKESSELAEWFAHLPPISSGSSQSSIAASGCLMQLQTNMLALRSKTLRQMQSCLVRLQQAGPRALLTFLLSLSDTLDTIRADYEVQRQDCLRRESSAWRAYYNLRAPLEEGNWGWIGQTRVDKKAVLRALTTAYDFKLRAEIYTQAAQLVGELVQQTRLYSGSVARLDAILNSLQGWFTERGSVEPLFLPLLKNSLAERVNPVQLQSELKNWVGYASEQNPSEELREELLTRIRPVCLEVYTDCCRYILNLDIPNQQIQQLGTAQPLVPSSRMFPSLEKRVSLHVCDTEIQDVLAMLSRSSGEKMVADESISGTVSLTLHDLSLTEAMQALIVAGNLSYTKSGGVYTFSQQPRIAREKFSYDTNV